MRFITRTCLGHLATLNLGSDGTNISSLQRHAGHEDCLGTSIRRCGNRLRVNSTYERVASADTNPRFIKSLLLTANGKHGVIESDDLLPTLRAVIETIYNWFNYSFRSGSTPPRPPRCGWKSSTAPGGFGSRRRRAAESATSTSTSRPSLIRCCSRPVIWR